VSPEVIRFDVPNEATLDGLIQDRLPLGLGAPVAVREFMRDVYYDTTDGVLDQSGLQCRVRYHSDGVRTLTTISTSRGGGPATRADTEITGRAASAALAERSAATDLLWAALDPAALEPIVEVRTNRFERSASWLWLPTECCRIILRRNTIVAFGQKVRMTGADVVGRAGLGPSPSRVARALASRYGLVPDLVPMMTRARALIATDESLALASTLRSPRECAVLLVRDGAIGLKRHEDQLVVFWKEGAGEAGCRATLDEAFGSSQAQIRCLGQVPGRTWRRPVEVWLARRLPESVMTDPSIEWLPMSRLVELAGTPALRDARTLSALNQASQSDVMKEQTHGVRPPSIGPQLSPVPRPIQPIQEDAMLLDADMSQLDFNARVLELAADDSVSVGDRLNYLSIVAANLDEFVMVRTATLKRSQSSTLDAVRLRTRALSEHMQACLENTLRPELADRGVHLRRWNELHEVDRLDLTRRFHEEIRPRLIPLALTPTHPFPHIGNIESALAVKLRHPETDHIHYGTVRIPGSLARFWPVTSGSGRTWITIEQLIVGHLATLFSGVDVLRAHLFRVTRSGEVAYDDPQSTDLLQHVADVIDRRLFQPVVRLEIERDMPAEMRALLLQEFRFELPDQVSDLEEADVVAIDGLLAMRGLREVASAIVSRVPVKSREALFPEASIFDTLQHEEVLVHFPYDSFSASVMRFLREACDDTNVEAVTVTLYRTNDDSPIVQALYHARTAGKAVLALVELKARFDEARNIETAKALRAAGVQVVYGVAGMKLHSKVILILRREGTHLRRYAFIGSGNLNPTTAGLYTDVGLFTGNQNVTRELAAVVDSLTGLTTPPEPSAILVSPQTMLKQLLDRIGRQREAAAAGAPSGIRAKMNGLDDPEVIQALYAASQAGVPISLSVRGICRLRPGVPGLSDNIRVVSILGEFLEHARMVEFGHGQAREYYLGSADWRERNLRRRVEVMTPVTDERAKARLSDLLDVEFSDRGAWQLFGDGTWRRSDDRGEGMQRQLLRRLARQRLMG